MSHGCVRSHVLAAIAGSVLAANASADVVMLHNGGQVRGELLSAADAPVVKIRTLLGGTVSIEQFEIDAVERRSPLIEDYATRARDVADTVKARWDLAEWCLANGLKDRHDEQLALLLDVDPEHAAARKALGHVRHNEQWMTRDEWMTSRGFVWHEGKYVSEREFERLLFSEAGRAANAEWFPKVRQWLVWMVGSNPQLSAQARANFKALKDPEAVPAVVNFFGRNRDSSMRMMGVQLLSQIEGLNGVGPLVRESIYDSEHEVRIAAREAIKPDQHDVALEFYVPELRSETNTVVNRSAVGIGEIGDKSAVKFLIPALVTRHHRIHPTVYDQVPLHANRMALRGASHLPYGAVVVNSFAPDTGIEFVVSSCKGNVANPDVLEALRKITGQDFGYDKRAWKAWCQTEEGY